MRTTVDLPPAVRLRAEQLARSRGESLSSVIADLTVRGLNQLGEPVQITTDPVSGFPVLTLGVRVTSAYVADLVDDE